ncbi:MAG TPA: hypothetical protein VLI41_09145 [Phenylobacterium sp.]|uniref:hypothetical protein n=1 Tax=Phenylobacterium sp. TaxID=1871053 RepID=UPI002C103C4F|nr:hypothetical protein [Phenylobacterium sp.]HSV03358.1 hypothetical protein [Phenylobacterium sp.]
MRTIFLVGTVFCGSTAIARELARDDRIDTMGEIDRLSSFRPWSGRERDRVVDRCRICGMAGREHECPIFDESLIQEATAGGLREGYAAVRRRFAAPVAIDGSKNPAWVRQVAMSTSGLDTAAIILARLPWAFAYSHSGASGEALAASAAVWRDTYQEALQVVADLGIPCLVIRYEDFILNRKAGLEAVSRLLGFTPEATRPLAVGLHHAVGGNLGAFLGMDGIDEAAVRAAQVEPGELFKLEAQQLRSDELTLVERWRGELNVAEFSAILRVPGVWEMGRLLGFDLVHHLTR